MVVLTGMKKRAQKGIKSMLAEHATLIDADLALNDGGGVSRARVLCLRHPASEENVPRDYQLEVTDVGGHSSLVDPMIRSTRRPRRFDHRRTPVSAAVTEVAAIILERLVLLAERGQTAIAMRGVAAESARPAAAARFAHAVIQCADAHDVRRDARRCRSTAQQRAAAGRAGRSSELTVLPGLPGADVK